MRSYFVFFVVDAVDDDIAREVRRRVQALAGAREWAVPPGFFDDPQPAPGSPRTTGGFLRVEGETADGGELRDVCAAIQSLSTALELEVEMQWREEILGRIRAGVPDDGLEEKLAAVAGEPVDGDG